MARRGIKRRVFHAGQQIPEAASRRPPCPPLENPSFALVRIYYTALAILSSRGRAKARDMGLIGWAP